MCFGKRGIPAGKGGDGGCGGFAGDPGQFHIIAIENATQIKVRNEFGNMASI